MRSWRSGRSRRSGMSRRDRRSRRSRRSRESRRSRCSRRIRSRRSRSRRSRSTTSFCLIIVVRCRCQASFFVWIKLSLVVFAKRIFYLLKVVVGCRCLM